MENSNGNLARFCVDKLGVPYVMGTNGRVLKKTALNDLARRNPGGWFTVARLPTVRSWIGRKTTDCHGLVEWFLAELAGGKWVYDVTADGAYAAAEEKGGIGTIPEQPGVCVRYPGHVGVYIGGGYVVEARGFDYGVCLTRLTARPWTHWYRHNRIKYTDTALPMPESAQINKVTSRYSIIWLQLALNRQIAAGNIKGEILDVDGVYGSRTAAITAVYWQHKGWTEKTEVWGVGKNTIKALGRW